MTKAKKESRTPKAPTNKKKETDLIKSTYNPKTGTFMSEAKTISLTIGERVAALKLFDAFKGSISTLATLLDDVKQFTVSNEEWEKANLVKTPNKNAQGEPDGTEQWKWDETVENEITLQEGSYTYLKDEIKKKSDAGDITLADVALVSLEKKL